MFPQHQESEKHPNKNSTQAASASGSGSGSGAPQSTSISLEQHFSRHNSRSSSNIQDGAVSTQSLATRTIQTSASAPKLTSQQQDIMRRRTTRDPRLYYPDNSNNEHKSTGDGTATATATGTGTAQGYFLHQSSSLSPVRQRRGPGGPGGPDNHQGGNDLSSPLPPNSPKAHPTIADFMQTDQQYMAFLLSGNAPHTTNSTTRIHHAQNTNTNDSFFSQPFNLQVSKFTTIFSLIATIILFIFGLLIEIQPLYIKGISPKRTPMTRNLHGQYSTYSFVHFSARLRILQNVTLSQSNTNHEEMSRMMESMIFEMKDEAKVAFKACALYFLIMVLSFIYSQNHVLVHANLQRMSLGNRVRNLVHGLPRNFILLIRRYRRRHYNHVQEVNAHSHGHGHGHGHAPGIGLAKVRITKNANTMNANAMAASNHSDYDSSSGREDFDMGLSMRERPHSRTRRMAVADGIDRSNITSNSNNNIGSSTGIASSAWDAMVDKTKKG